jgi:hypothetical protein
MEILFEILLGIFGAFLESMFEILAEAALEIVAGIGLRIITEPFRRPTPVNPVFAGIGYALYGAVAGGVSLLFPRMFMVAWWLRLLNVIITPVACGFIMAKLGQMREKQGNSIIRINTFFYGYLFALSMAVVRFVWR